MHFSLKEQKNKGFIEALSTVGIPRNVAISVTKDGVFNPKLVELTPKEILEILERRHKYYALLPHQWERILNRPWGSLRIYCKASGENDKGETLYRLTVPVKNFRSQKKEKTTEDLTRGELLEFFEAHIRTNQNYTQEHMSRPRLLKKDGTPYLSPEETARLVIRQHTEDAFKPFRMPIEYWEKIYPGSARFLREEGQGEYVCTTITTRELRRILSDKDPYAVLPSHLRERIEKEKLTEELKKIKIRRAKVRGYKRNHARKKYIEDKAKRTDIDTNNISTLDDLVKER